jgi:hypothetical protein
MRMPFKRRLLLFLLLLGFGLAVGATESSVNETPAAQKPREQEQQPPGASQSDKQAEEEDSQADFGADFTPFTPSEEILTDRPAAFPADI